MLLVTAAEMRELDRLTIEKYGTPGFTLMQRAGRGAAQVLLKEFPHVRRHRVVVCAGRGNNGGDGFVIARELKAKKVAVEVVLVGKKDQVQGDAARAMAAFIRARGKISACTAARDVSALQERLVGAGVIVDALFGTGLRGPIQGTAADVIALINASGVPVFAVDIPSGLDSDRGVPLGETVQAEATATFGFAKVGQVIHPGIEHTGRLAVVDIGIAAGALSEVPLPTRLLEREEIGALVPRRAATAHKGDTGHVLIIAGSRGKTGAAKLAAGAALRTGAGLVTVASPASQQPIIASGLLEAMTEPLAETDGQLDFDGGSLQRLVDGKRAVVFGPGIGTGAGPRQALGWLLANATAPLVIDADGLGCLAHQLELLHKCKSPVILTPHPGEMSRLAMLPTGDVQADRVGLARRFATTHGCTLVLKGACTVIASPDGTVAINPTGNPGMASGGMGDVLSGILGALLAQGLSAADAACTGAFVHGAAADDAAAELGTIGIIASDVTARVPRTLATLMSESDGA